MVIKPVFIVVNGYSVTKLEHRIEEFKDFDVTWGSLMQNYQILQDNILFRIGKTFDILHSKNVYVNVGSLANMLIWLIKEGHDKIFLFGADGGRINSNGKLYYKDTKNEIDSLLLDSWKINCNFWEWIRQLGLNENVEIVNCSMKSKITCFKKCTYERLIKRMNNENLPI